MTIQFYCSDGEFDKPQQPCVHRLTPAPHQPGTLRQQFEIIDVFLSDPTRREDREGAWQMARRLVLPHARITATPTDVVELSQRRAD